jgi:hypothetical protein
MGKENKPSAMFTAFVWNFDIDVGRATVGRNFDVNIGRAEGSKQLKFGYQFSICSRPRAKLRESLSSSWPVAGAPDAS